MAGTWPGGWISGFCAIGHCEGTKPKGALTGTPMQVCTTVDDCACACHVRITQMFEMAGMPRQIMENPDYQPAPVTWWMPTPEERVAMRVAAAKPEVRPVIVPSALPDVLPPAAVRTYAETPSGKRAPGSLEEEVRKATDAWTGMSKVIPGMEPCTMKWIANFIDSENPPSTGAVNAVIDRWVEYGFATMEKKPTRFTGYTAEGVQKGLFVMKEAYKQKKRQHTSNLEKGRR